MNMLCANKDCKAELKYLRGGRLFLMERQPARSLVAVEAATQPKRPGMMRRYFWLCESCAQSHSIQRWTDAGIELAPRRPVKHLPISAMANPRGLAMPGLVG